MRYLYRALATGLFVGYIPFAPATFGSLWAFPIAFLTGTSTPDYWITFLALLVIAVVSADRVAEERGVKDPREVVIDEIVAMYMALATLPLRPGVMVVGFLLFRAYDVIKPFPARRAEGLPGGWGIVADDLIAGAYTWATLKVLLHLFPALAT